MSKLMISDLTATQDLDREAAVKVTGGVRGGYMKRAPGHGLGGLLGGPSVNTAVQVGVATNVAVAIGGFAPISILQQAGIQQQVV